MSDNTSGHGVAAVIPREIDRWNWDAFLLNWIWGLGNNTFIALLMFVPGVNFVVPFVLGFKGSAWAWRNKRWQSPEHFRHVQRLWTIWGVIAWVVVLTFIAAVWFGVMAMFKHSEPYQLAVTRLQGNAEAVAVLGTPITTGNSSGSISTSGASGRAELAIPVEGSKARGTLYLRATKDFGAWKLERIELEVEGRRSRINLGEGDRVRLEVPRGQLAIRAASPQN
jgi:cytochrome oxidase complex assembly protein 1